MTAPVPSTRYARSGSLSIAYQVLGDGDVDLVFAGGWVTHLEHAWQQPRIAAFYRRLAGFARLIVFDKRGTGLSDRIAADRAPTLEERMDDLRAVMDTVGSERAALFGASEGGSMSMLFAATYPERVQALILYAAYARRIRAPNFPWGPTQAEWDQFIDSLEAMWGGPVALDMVAPSVAGNPAVADWWAAYMRMGATPTGATELLRMNAGIDVRPILTSIGAPTLVLHRTGDLVFPIDFSRNLAERIPGARFVELPGIDHQFWAGDPDALAAEIEEFLTGSRQAPSSDRVLTTILFTDIVDSTRRLAEIGDSAWRSVLDSHDALVGRILDRYSGVLVDTSGDGLFARFEGPARAILAAVELRASMRDLGLQIRVGLHTGEVERAGDKVRGIAVHLAARVMGTAEPEEILVTRTVRDLVAGSGIGFGERGSHRLKGIPGEWDLLRVLDDAGRPAILSSAPPDPRATA